VYKAEYSNNAKQFLKKVEEEIAKRIIEKIEELQNNAFPPDRKKVQGRKDEIYRVRVGRYRILYVIIKDSNVLLISKIDKRDGVYD
jgi:mRNA interferase RelE/StbE